MTALLMLVPMSLVLLLLAVWLFRWAVRKGQFENLDAAAIDILRDDSADRPRGEEGPEAGEGQGPILPDSGDTTGGDGTDHGRPARARGTGAHAD